MFFELKEMQPLHNGMTGFCAGAAAGGWAEAAPITSFQ